MAQETIQTKSNVQIDIQLNVAGSPNRIVIDGMDITDERIRYLKLVFMHGQWFYNFGNVAPGTEPK